MPTYIQESGKGTKKPRNNKTRKSSVPTAVPVPTALRTLSVHMTLVSEVPGDGMEDTPIDGEPILELVVEELILDASSVD